MSAAILLVAIMWIVTVAVCWHERRTSRAHAKAIHPANTVTVVDAAVVPLLCPRCLTTFANAYLAESGNTVGGWIEMRGHECEATA